MQPEPVLDTDVYKRARCVQLPGVMPGPTRAQSPTWKGHGGGHAPGPPVLLPGSKGREMGGVALFSTVISNVFLVTPLMISSRINVCLDIKMNYFSEQKYLGNYSNW